MPLETYRLLSAPLIHTPSLLRWAQVGYRTRNEKHKRFCINLFSIHYGLNPGTCELLLNEQIPIRIVGDVVEFDLEEPTVIKPG